MLTAVLTITGLVAVYSASFVIGLARFSDPNYYIVRQVAWAVLGVVLMVVAMRIDYRIYRLRGSPAYPTPQRFYAGINVNF